MNVFLSASNVTVGDAALYALVGFIIVVAVLALLVGIFYLSGFLFNHVFKPKSKTDAPVPAPEPEPEPLATTPVENDDEVVAAITAAISLVLSGESDEPAEKPDFVIRRIVRKK